MMRSGPWTPDAPERARCIREHYAAPIAPGNRALRRWDGLQGRESRALKFPTRPKFPKTPETRWRLERDDAQRTTGTRDTDMTPISSSRTSTPTSTAFDLDRDVIVTSRRTLQTCHLGKCL
jgi:hypothetical protein